MALSTSRRMVAFAAGLAVMALSACSGDEESAPSEHQPSPTVRFESALEGQSDHVLVEGLGVRVLRELERRRLGPSEWGKLFAVRVVASRSDGEGVPPLLGEYSVSDGGVVFEPRFPFEPGVTYRAVWLGIDPDLATPVETTYRLEPKQPMARTRVTAVYPSAEELPENLLRFYVHFSASMSRGEASQRVRLLGPDGEVTLPFVAPEQELWSPERDRLTLLLDPGRIKQEVGPHEELGPPLVEGARYRLVIAGDWADGRGMALQEGFVKEFVVTAADRSAPRPEEWDLSTPEGPRDSLSIRFAEALDHGLLAHMIRVETDGGTPVPGQIEIGAGESSWSFRPDGAWQTGSYRVVVEAALEDPAGNSVRRTFDTPMGDEVGEGERRQPVVLDFSIASTVRG